MMAPRHPSKPRVGTTQPPLRVQLGQPGATKWLPTYSRPARLLSQREAPGAMPEGGLAGPGLARPKAVRVMGKEK